MIAFKYNNSINTQTFPFKFVVYCGHACGVLNNQQTGEFVGRIFLNHHRRRPPKRRRVGRGHLAQSVYIHKHTHTTILILHSPDISSFFVYWRKVWVCCVCVCFVGVCLIGCGCGAHCGVLPLFTCAALIYIFRVFHVFARAGSTASRQSIRAQLAYRGLSYVFCFVVYIETHASCSHVNSHI